MLRLTTCWSVVVFLNLAVVSVLCAAADDDDEYSKNDFPSGFALVLHPLPTRRNYHQQYYGLDCCHWHVRGLFALFCFFVIRWFSNRYEILWNWPIMGSLPNLLVNIYRHRLFDWLVNQLTGGVSSTFLFKGPWFANMNILATVDPDNIHYILNTNFSNYVKGPEFKKRLDIFGDGLFSADSDSWKFQRKTAVALLADRSFYQFLVKTTKDKVERGLIPLLDQVASRGIEVDMQALAHHFTGDINWKLIAGFDPENLSIDFQEEDFFKAMDEVEKVIFYRYVTPEIFWKLQRKLRFGFEPRMERAWKTIDQTIECIISKKRGEVRSSQEGEFVDLLASYTSMHLDGLVLGSKSVDTFLRDTAFNFLVATRENSLAWFFWLTATNPDVEAKIVEELKSIVPSDETEQLRVFHSEEIKNLVYLHAAICETLRLYPPVPFMHKNPIKPDILPSGHRVHPRMKIISSSYIMGRMRCVWGDDCLEFKPERWISEEGCIKHVASHKLMAFNTGPRVCVGKQIALTQMKAMAAAVVYNYHVKVAEGQKMVPTCASFILHIKNGLKVNIQRRWA